jgi:hypothetical protein
MMQKRDMGDRRPGARSSCRRLIKYLRYLEKDAPKPRNVCN